MNEKIGELISVKHTLKFVCNNCLDNLNRDSLRIGCPVFRINIGLYKQSCFNCHQVIIESENGWCELYD